MADLDHVGAKAGDGAEQAGQRSRGIGQQAAQAEEAPRGGQAVPQQLGQQQRVDVAPGQDRDDRRLEPAGAGQQRGDPRRPGGLDHLLGAFQAEQQGPGERRLRHGDDPVALCRQDAEGDVARPAHGYAVGHRRQRRHRHRTPRGDRARVGRHRLRLHADDPHGGVEALHRHGDPRCQAPAADRDQDGPGLRALLDDLQAEGPLARHDVGVVERVDEDASGPRRDAQRLVERVLDRRAVQHHRRAVTAGRLHLRQRCPLRHHHGGGGAQQARGERHALRVVARARRHHAAGPLGSRQPGDPHIGPAYLERPGALQVLALEVDRAADLLREHPRIQQRGRRDHLTQQLTGGDHVVGRHQ